VVWSGDSDDVDDGLADLLEPPRTPRVGELAFADTIHVRDLPLNDTGEHELPPASGPVIVNDPDQGTQWMTPFAFPLPPAAEQVSLSTKLRILSARIRHGLRGSVEEAREAWSQTNDAPSPVERVKALWSLWQWESGDLVRAAVIGGAVFLVVATIGALALGASDDGDRTASGSGITAVDASGEVRAPRTVDQHTGRVFYPSPSLRTRR